MDFSKCGRRLKNCGTKHCPVWGFHLKELNFVFLLNVMEEIPEGPESPGSLT